MVKEQCSKEQYVGSWFLPTLQQCGQLQKFCETMPDQYNIASGHICDMQVDLHQNLDRFMRCEQYKVAENPILGSKSPFLATLCCSHLMNQSRF